MDEFLLAHAFHGGGLEEAFYFSIKEKKTGLYPVLALRGQPNCFRVGGSVIAFRGGLRILEEAGSQGECFH